MLLFKSPILVLFVISMMIKGCCGIFVRKKNKGSRTMEEFKDLISGESDKETEEWALKKGIMDMETVMEEGRRDPPIDLIKLFSQTPPSEVSLSSHLNLSKDHRLLSMILLVRIAMVSAPNPLGEILFRSLSEAYEVIGFVDRRLSYSSSNSRTKSKIVKAAWQYMKNEDFSTGNELMSQSPSLGAIKELRDKMPKDIVSEELDILVNLIEIRACASNEELYNFIKQIFVDLLHEVLKELPNIIFFYVIESPVEEYESRVSRVMKFVCKIELLGTRVSWVFPKDTNILCLVAPEVPTPSSHSISIVEGDNTLNGVDDDLRLLEVTIVHVNQPEDI
ncbi:hypothetical protein GIB67_038901 [Kingdonia uniflora]|uniref:Uncharacterized protein n=1 Tax=Kingdonia uniflora TaxID=39325 RepID=A0A7J7LQI3_9MAGN|nr:hypothetical protein GIB67_038901 [Kingdonia uniflora]